MLHHYRKILYKHSGDIGDVIYSLPVIRYFGGGSIALHARILGTKKDKTLSGFDDEKIRILIPLLESQDYIIKAKKFEESVDTVFFNMDKYRDDFHHYRYTLKIFNLWQIILKTFNVPYNEVNSPWLTCDKKKIAKVVFARSFRYRNHHHRYEELVEQHKKDSIFVGLENEYKNFVTQFGKIDYYPVKDFLELAEVINGSELFIGNQSSPMSIAIALHKPFIQEKHKQYPDCVFQRKNAQYM